MCFSFRDRTETGAPSTGPYYYNGACTLHVYNAVVNTRAYIIATYIRFGLLPFFPLASPPPRLSRGPDSDPVSLCAYNNNNNMCNIARRPTREAGRTNPVASPKGTRNNIISYIITAISFVIFQHGARFMWTYASLPI